MALSAFLLWRKMLYTFRPALWVLMFMLPFPYIANTAGWITADLGRQPWLIYGLMRTAQGASANVSTGNALFTLLGFMGLYSLLSVLFLFLPMASPEIVMGSSLLALFVAIGLGGKLGFWTILIAHIMFCLSFVVVTVKARLSGIDSRLEEAAMDLYANEWQTFWRITFPLVFPGILGAAMLSFSLSFDDFIVTNITAGTTTTFPMFVWGAARREMMAPSCVRRTSSTVAASESISATTIGSAPTERNALSMIARVDERLVGRIIRCLCSSTSRRRLRAAKGWSSPIASTISSMYSDSKCSRSRRCGS